MIFLTKFQILRKISNFEENLSILKEIWYFEVNFYSNFFYRIFEEKNGNSTKF